MENMRGAYEQQQVEGIETWEVQTPSTMARTMGFIAAPLAWAARKLIPEEVMEKAIDAALNAAAAVSGSDDLLDDANKLGFEAASLGDLAKAPLHVSDGIAENVTDWAKGLAAAEGAITGMTGLPGLTADIPALLILAIRTIRRLGACYGFDTAAEAERAFILQTLRAGAANTMEDKKSAIEGALQVRSVLDGADKAVSTREQSAILGREAFTAAVRNLAKQLCINITRRKAVQVIPVVGGGVGAAMNVMFISDVAEAAFRLYQKRRLEIQAVDTTSALAEK